MLDTRADRRPAWATAAVRAGRAGGTLLARRPELLTLALCLAVIASGRHGPDFPAQAFRVWLFRRQGALLWNDQWYSGHPVPGYSLLFPPLAGVFGTAAVGAAACVASTLAARLLFREITGRGGTTALLWFAVAVVGDLVVGRLPFALGLALGLAALVGVQTSRPKWAAVMAVLCSLASPLAGAFLLMAAGAMVVGSGWRRVAPLAGAGVGLATAYLFGGGGVFPFPALTLLSVTAFVGLALLLAPARYRLLRRGAALYGAAALVLFALPNPVGGNLARLGALLAGPVAAFVLISAGRRRLLLLLTGPLLCWQLSSVTTALADSSDDISGHPAYYAGLAGYLAGHDQPIGRVEIPLTRNHWETSFVAPEFPLARGWERQLDLRYNTVLYGPTLDPASYHEWLRDSGVRWVAVPDVPLDPSARLEAAVIEDGGAGLIPRWHDAHWRLWEVAGAAPMLTGPATLDRLGTSGFDLTFRAAGTARLLVHFNQFWHVDPAVGCVAESSAGWTSVTALRPGTVTVSSRLSLPAFDSDVDCPR